jgi:2-phospho-L-lactate guanylyltransferase
MPTAIVPFRGAEGKSRMAGLQPAARAALASAMLADVLEACRPAGAVYVVTPAPRPDLQATVVRDGGRGQGAAVAAALRAAVAGGGSPPYLVRNADLPCVTPDDVRALAAGPPAGGLALVAAADGTTNALALAAPDLFAPVYGPGSAERFARLAPSRLLVLPNLVDDVDTVDDLRRLRDRLGAHTRRALAELLVGAAA